MDSEGASWQVTLDINLRAALVGTRLAARAMTRQRTKGGPHFSPRPGRPPSVTPHCALRPCPGVVGMKV